MAAIQRYVYKAGSVVLGGQQPISLDYIKIPFQVSVVVDIVSGAANYGVEFTTDDLNGNPANFRWLPTVEFAAGQDATKQALISYPVTALRLNISSMTGEVRLAVLQGLGI